MKLFHSLSKYGGLLLVFVAYREALLYLEIDKAPLAITSEHLLLSLKAPQREGFDCSALPASQTLSVLLVYKWNACKFQSESPSC